VSTVETSFLEGVLFFFWGSCHPLLRSGSSLKILLTSCESVPSQAGTPRSVKEWIIDRRFSFKILKRSTVEEERPRDNRCDIKTSLLQKKTSKSVRRRLKSTSWKESGTITQNKNAIIHRLSFYPQWLETLVRTYVSS
jgi:hypothetical protein